MIGHKSGGRFRPTGKGGGSRKGKPQSNYPLIIKVVASALQDRAAGSWEARILTRSGLSEKEFKKQMALALPGVWEWIEEHMPGRESDRVKLLMNRPYKGDAYSGTSDRRKPHDPKTRASVPRENWRRRVPVDSPLMRIYDDIRASRITTVANWHQYLPLHQQPLF